MERRTHTRVRASPGKPFTRVDGTIEQERCETTQQEQIEACTKCSYFRRLLCD